MPRKRTNRAKPMTRESLINARTTDILRSSWHINDDDTYTGAQARYADDKGQLALSASGGIAFLDPSDYALAHGVLSAHCNECGGLVARLYVADSTPWSSHVEIARYAYWASAPAMNRCRHKGSLPAPATLIDDISRALKSGIGRGFGKTAGAEPRTRIKVQPLSV